ncbi:MAG: DUF726 domain-containing protein [Lentisphaeria bacterium]|nr:DUF726 domain-containing protein [Lentisphaeria bacterium]
MKKVFFIVAFLAFSLLSAREVFFVPGWRTGSSAREGCVRIMRDIWPGVPISVKSWNSRVPYKEARNNAASFSKELFNEIRSMPESRRRDLILVGHSIGAGIVLEVISNLAAENMQILEAALLGGAVPDDDARMWDLFKVVRTRCYGVAFAGDAVLKLLYPLSESGSPLGLTGWKFCHPRWVETRIEQKLSFFNHYAYLYLEELDRLVDSLPPPREIVISDAVAPYHFDENGLYWQKVDNVSDWELQKHLFYPDFRILDPEKRVRYTGSEAPARRTFADIVRQLSSVPAK